MQDTARTVERAEEPTAGGVMIAVSVLLGAFRERKFSTCELSDFRNLVSARSETFIRSLGRETPVGASRDVEPSRATQVDAAQRCEWPVHTASPQRDDDNVQVARNLTLSTNHPANLDPPWEAQQEHHRSRRLRDTTSASSRETLISATKAIRCQRPYQREQPSLVSSSMEVSW